MSTIDTVTISCIMPAYNEEKNIQRVLDVVSTYSRFSQVIVIDDGSDDRTTQIAKSYQQACPVLKVITLPKKNGKAGVIKRGVFEAKGDLIVMLDSDLIGLTHRNIDALIEPVVSKEVDQTVLDRAGDRTPIWGWTNCAKYFGGERAFWKKDFLGIDIPDNAGYLLEITSNLHYIQQGKTIRTIFCSNLYTVHQFNKMDMISGLRNYVQMSVDIIRHATVPGFVKQFFFIENQNTHGLFLFYRDHPSLRPLSGLTIMLFHLGDGISWFVLLNMLKLIKLPVRLVRHFTK